MRCALLRRGVRRHLPAFVALATASALPVLLGPVALRAQVSPEVVSQAIANACRQRPEPSEAVIAGVVSDSTSGVALPGVEMTLTWRGAADTVRSRQVMTTGSDGFFVFCKVPGGVSATLMAHARRTRGPFTLNIDPGQLYVQNVLLPLSSPLRKGVLVGQVIDAEARIPVVDATVRLVEPDKVTTTNSHGFFTFGEQPYGVYTVEVARLGYADYSAPVRVAGDLQQSVQIRIAKQALELDGLKVTVQASRRRSDLDGLVHRMNLGFGTFITADQLDKRPMARVTDILRGTPGVWVDVNQRDRTFTLEVRGHPCRPDIFIDGIWYAGQADELTIPPAEDLEAVEVYKGNAEIPATFRTGSPQCAVIAVWSRVRSRR